MSDADADADADAEPDMDEDELDGETEAFFSFGAESRLLVFSLDRDTPFQITSPRSIICSRCRHGEDVRWSHLG